MATVTITLPTVEGKVTAASVAAALSGGALALLDQNVLHSTAWDGYITPVLGGAAVAVVTFVVGFIKRHTPRPDLLTAEQVLANPAVTAAVVAAVQSGAAHV